MPESLFEQSLLKKTLAQVLSREVCEISKNTSFAEQFWTTVSAFYEVTINYRSIP